MAYDEPLQNVLKIVGGPTKLARHLGIVPSAVTQWERVPLRHLWKVAKFAGVPVERLRPDLVKGEE